MAERSVRGSVVKAIAAEATRRKREKDESNETPTEEEGPRRSRPRRACRDAPVQTLAAAAPAAAAASQPSLPLKGKLLVIHANTKTYGRGGDTAAAGDDHQISRGQALEPRRLQICGQGLHRHARRRRVQWRSPGKQAAAPPKTDLHGVHQASPARQGARPPLLCVLPARRASTTAH